MTKIIRPWHYILLVAVAAALQAAQLIHTGQPAICACGTIRLWAGDILSAENSQQISDWYTPSHILHGMIFYAALAFGLRRLVPRLPLIVSLALALGVEITWELLENSPVVIDRYREQALAQGYSGDSVLNSVCDTLAMSFGFWLAGRLPVRLSIALALAAEIFTAVMVRDNLTLNVIQLLSPSPRIAAWQSEGGLMSAPLASPGN